MDVFYFAAWVIQSVSVSGYICSSAVIVKTWKLGMLKSLKKWQDIWVTFKDLIYWLFVYASIELMKRNYSGV